MPPPETPRIRLPAGVDAQQAIRYATRAAYNIEADDVRLRAIREKPAEERSAYFKSLRKNYPVRREFPQTTVALDAADQTVVKALETLGFPTETRTKPK